MITRIKCDKCDWFKHGGYVPVWYFRKCPKCGAEVINGKDLSLWMVVKVFEIVDRITRLFMKNPELVNIHIDSAELTKEPK